MTGHKLFKIQEQVNDIVVIYCKWFQLCYNSDSKHFGTDGHTVLEILRTTHRHRRRNPRKLLQQKIMKETARILQFSQNVCASLYTVYTIVRKLINYQRVT